MDKKFDETVKEILSEIDELGYSSSERVEYSDTLESSSHYELQSRRGISSDKRFW